jgi:predicted O-methyltransferase YrrM
MPRDPDKFIEKRARRRGVAHIGAALVKQPQYVPRYVRHNLWRRQSPLELELPWMPYAVIDFLDRKLDRESVVLELGSGGSTLFLARRAGSVTSFEENEQWATDVADALRRAHLTNVRLEAVSADFGDLANLADSEYWRALPDSPVDVIIVDSSDYQTHEARPMLFSRMEQIVRPGGVIVVDDAWRYPQLRQRSRASSVKSYRGVGPGTTRPQWSDVYFY